MSVEETAMEPHAFVGLTEYLSIWRRPVPLWTLLPPHWRQRPYFSYNPGLNSQGDLSSYSLQFAQEVGQLYHSSFGHFKGIAASIQTCPSLLDILIPAEHLA